jgi:hypothetical protein
LRTGICNATMCTVTHNTLTGIVTIAAAWLMLAAAACGGRQPFASPTTVTATSRIKANAWCSHAAGLTAATGKSVAEGLPVLAEVAAQLATDADEARRDGFTDAADAIEALATQIRTDHDLIQLRGWTISLLVFPETDDSGTPFVGFGHVSKEVRAAVHDELLAQPGVQSATWSPNSFTVRFGTFVTWTTTRAFQSLPKVASVAPDVGDVGLDLTQTAQQDAQVSELHQLGCRPDSAVTASTIPALP